MDADRRTRRNHPDSWLSGLSERLKRSTIRRPSFLCIRGTTKLFTRSSIAIVGTRHPSPTGTGIAEGLARARAASRLLIVSGMVRDIDIFAH